VARPDDTAQPKAVVVPLRPSAAAESDRTSSRRTPERVFDELLVTLAQGGDPQAFDRLARRWRPRHYAHARRLLRSPDAAADAVQDAWIGIVRGLRLLNDPARFPAWSYAIVTRRCRDQQRRDARTPASEPYEDAPAPPGSDPGVASDLRRALAALPADQRAAVALFYLDGFTAAEIAEALGAPVGTIKTRLFHARRSLRRTLEGEES
jgi:RNA polymerase sigma-70 factor (ECF subfamily)